MDMAFDADIAAIRTATVFPSASFLPSTATDPCLGAQKSMYYRLMHKCIVRGFVWNWQKSARYNVSLEVGNVCMETPHTLSWTECPVPLRGHYLSHSETTLLIQPNIETPRWTAQDRLLSHKNLHRIARLVLSSWGTANAFPPHRFIEHQLPYEGREALALVGNLGGNEC